MYKDFYVPGPVPDDKGTYNEGVFYIISGDFSKHKHLSAIEKPKKVKITDEQPVFFRLANTEN